MFAYGQTNSGKTHTMRGSAAEPGVIPLAVQHVFDKIQEVLIIVLIFLFSSVYYFLTLFVTIIVSLSKKCIGVVWWFVY